MSAGCPIAVHVVSGLAVEFCETLSASHAREMREEGRVPTTNLDLLVETIVINCHTRPKGTTWRGDLSLAYQLSSKCF